MPPSVRCLFATIFSLIANPIAWTATAATLAGGAPEWAAVKPVFAETCFDCHSTSKTKGGVNLKGLADDPAVAANYALWEKVREVIAKGDMPPEDETQLSPEEKTSLLTWADHALDAVATANAGDPGPVTLRRLTNAEYDRTIRDLTGHDLQLAREFQPDGGGGEGFSNIGDVLFLSPAQLDRYLTAARKLADHASILPGTGIVIHPQRIGLRGPAQLKAQADQALYVWYQKAAAPHLPGDRDDLREADYMLACWRWKHRSITGAESVRQLARDAGLAVAFLENWWRLLNDEHTKSRFLDLTRMPWRALPPPDPTRPREVPAPVAAAIQSIQAQRHSWYKTDRPGRSSVQRQQQDADGLRSYRTRADTKGHGSAHLVVGDCGDGAAGDYVQFSEISVRADGKTLRYTDWLRGRLLEDQRTLQVGHEAQPQSAPQIPVLERRVAEARAVLALFGKDPLGKKIAANVLAAKAPAVITLPLPPNASEISANGKLDLSSAEADQASAQWRLAVGSPPDPARILPGVLTVWKRQTQKSGQTMADFSRMKSAFPDEFERRLEEVARNHTRGDSDIGVYYFSDAQLGGLISKQEFQHLANMKIDFRFVAPSQLGEDRRREWDSLVRGHLRRFVAQAWRRPLSEDEGHALDELYGAGLGQGMDRESAAREVLVRALVSPNFLYKMELGLAAAGQGSGDATRETALTPWELASRLSYFLWSSMPDAALRQAAADSSLLKGEVLAAQVRRMLADPKAEALATEFAGQWLAFSGFAGHNAVDVKKFPEFTPELRRDLVAETSRFFTHWVRQDRPVAEILRADYTFLNERLAAHYGIPGVVGEELRQVTVAAHHRGGLLGQGSMLIKTSRGHRTSPVLRGNWLLQSVLGTPVPPPPSDVPELKEQGPKPATLREMLEQHRAAKACSSCHDRIDPLGFALENFDPIGRYRERDDSGLPLDTSGQVKGVSFAGFEGLRAYLATQEPQFTRHFCRKLLGYALGRQVLPTDKALLEKMKADLASSEGRISAAVLAVVQSRQFLNKRL